MPWDALIISTVKPDVRNYRIRLSDDLSAIGIHKELTALNSQVDKPLGLQCMIQRHTAKLPTVPLAPLSAESDATVSAHTS